MPQVAIDANQRMALRIGAKEKACLIQAATLQNTNLTEFVIRTAVSAANQIIEQHDHVLLSKRDSHFLLELLENPPRPNEKLLAAAFELPSTP